MWIGFAKDVRLIKKHFRKGISRGMKTDFLFNVVGFSLVTILGASILLQRDFIQEGFELVSPFRYDNPKSAFFGVYKILSSDEDPQQDRRVVPKSARFPNCDNVNGCENENGESAKS